MNGKKAKTKNGKRKNGKCSRGLTSLNFIFKVYWILFDAVIVIIKVNLNCYYKRYQLIFEGDFFLDL